MILSTLPGRRQRIPPPSKDSGLLRHFVMDFKEFCEQYYDSENWVIVVADHEEFIVIEPLGEEILNDYANAELFEIHSDVVTGGYIFISLLFSIEDRNIRAMTSPTYIEMDKLKIPDEVKASIVVEEL